MSAVTVPALKKHTATVIFMHGLGDSGNGWRFLAEEYRKLKVLDHVKFVFPNAPVQRVTVNFGMEMPSWFDLTSFDKIESQEDSQGMWKSVDRLKAFVADEVKEGISPDRIVIGGFSQGCAISLLAGLTTDAKYAGVVGLSGFIPMRSKISELHQTHGIKLPFFVGHGTADQVVKYEYAVFSKTKLAELGVPCEFHEYQGLAHSASPAEIAHVLEFLKKTIPE
ncbi:Phospholipase/carboxylesterase/thioesterase [Kockiozyma suomiensis]|uniref:Phospholipase/carboxylesterase/thioesterase n=1 Tax=Kockiozyma suomiensis TaxID=1337062 RepID=UPI00334323BB